MSATHLQDHQKKEFNKKIIVLSSIVIILLTIFLTFGVWLFVNVGTLTSQISGGKDLKNTESDFFSGDLIIDDLPYATGSASLIIEGEVTDFDAVEFYLNGDISGELVITENIQNFEYELGSLAPGENTIQIKAYTKDGKHKVASKIYRVDYKNKKPELEITEPQDGTRTTSYDIKIVGLTNPSNIVLINSAPVPVNAQGDFQFTVRLKMGDNNIDILARDTAGNETKKSITVTVFKDD